MGKRRDLLGITGNLLSSFVSRNNDLDGYWALGLLKTAANRESTSTISMNLLTASAEPKTATAAEVASSYGLWLRRELRNHKLPIEQVREANVAVEFGRFQGLAPPPQITRGEPFICTVRMIDDHGKIYQRSVCGWCDTHDPVREHRRRSDHRGVAV